MAQDWLRIEGPLGQLGKKKKKIHQKPPRLKDTKQSFTKNESELKAA